MSRLSASPGASRRSLGPLAPAALTLAAVLAAAACSPSGTADGRAPDPGRMSHDLLDAALGRHVRDGLVDYGSLKEDPDFGAYLGLLAATDPATLSGRPEKLAYWINAYNAFTLKGVLDHYPVTSIREVGLQGRFTFFRGLKFRAGGRDYTLDTIEHRILRSEFREARIHFAIVCASLSCPALRPEAFHPGRLEEELEEAARAFIEDPSRVSLDREKGILTLSPIFEWFREDFERASGSVAAYLRRYLSPEDAAYLARGKVAIQYNAYDWRLNDQARAGPGPAP